MSVPDRRQWLASGLGGLLIDKVSAAEKQVDRISLPPLRREFRSANGSWRLRIDAFDGWQHPRATATLLVPGGAADATRWSQSIDHEYGPRDAWVGNDGRVLLIDEWIQVASRRSLVLFDPQGKLLATHAHADIAAALGTSKAVLTRNATQGLWRSGGPRLAADGLHLLFEAGGRLLQLDLRDGSLQRLPP
jgi:hypothetical protein